MKKLLMCLLLAGLITAAAASCGEKTDDVDAGDVTSTNSTESADSSDSSESVGMPNPMVVVNDAAAIKDQTGAEMRAPADVTEVMYSVISGKVGQIIFEYNGIQYTYRGAKGMSGTELHGVYYEFDNPETLTVGDVSVTASGFGSDGTLATWTIGDVNYTLYTTSEINADTLQTVLDEILG